MSLAFSATPPARESRSAGHVCSQHGKHPLLRKYTCKLARVLPQYHRRGLEDRPPSTRHHVPT